MNTILASSSSGLTSYFIKPWLLKKFEFNGGYDIANIACGVLSGLVAITAPCNNVLGYDAIIIGIVSAIVFILSTAFLYRFKIDDPVDAT